MTYESYRELGLEIRDRVLTITLNRPDKANAVNEPMHEELARIFQDAALDDDVDVIVLTGAGRAFSAGGDVDWFQKMIDQPSAFEKTAAEGRRIVFSMLDCEKPIVAKVNGHAAGLGATMALFCDVIFASDKAKIGDPHVSVGFVAGDGGAVIWPQLIGYARAKEYLMTGELIPATYAAQIGLINYAVSNEELDVRVDEFVARLQAGARKAIRWTKVSVNIGLKQLAHSMMDASLSLEAQSNMTDDHQEAVNAFREKRTPVFTGR
ncbi:enoyl-CoA hydratase [Rhizobium petrolearium]|jgi:enoyl-CoA hydratase|uniref:Enoyl-CoA hydratase-related protein n=2 Tax=Neorhizobium TaxID=1525371 RepID=A0ABV0MAL8_9HYPH|nr:enoyl-CoA hydratase-related protein [Neorhizobium petrolearium]MBP1847264.1 enoyl-CoA hydratase [Neorhizobium petrolearium]MCC2614306.1 enoyl-CoA hydratase/isomerase family protein [Neorhizobium petrolearium]WGI72409.1 enoyl-CoA hydratase-related protein [Neorhizobium petrolearium]